MEANKKQKLELITNDDSEKKEKSDDFKTMFELSEGKIQKTDHLKPPYFPDATKRGIEPTTFKKRLFDLWNRRPQ